MGKVFSNRAMTLAAIDRLVHHATILEMNVESYRRKAALNATVAKAIDRYGRSTPITGRCMLSRRGPPLTLAA